ncbi:MAG TPA: septum formation family protein [Candidatus Limnocylindrales bacterium]
MFKLVSNIGIRIAIVVVIGVGAFVFRDRLSGAAADLGVGDCFDQPPALLEEIEDVQHHPCTESHDAEVFHVFNHSAATDASYPSDDAWGEIVFPNCSGPFAAYTGQSPQIEGELSWSMFTPTAAGWDLGDREVICFLYRSDGTAMTKSFRVANP